MQSKDNTPLQRKEGESGMLASTNSGTVSPLIATMQVSLDERQAHKQPTEMIGSPVKKAKNNDIR